MSTVWHYCVLVHSEVAEAVRVLAESPDQAKHLAHVRTPTGTLRLSPSWLCSPPIL
jgi:hypothetical protein